MYESLSEKWKGNHGGSGGDAFVLGLTSGLQKEVLQKIRREIKSNGFY